MHQETRLPQRGCPKEQELAELRDEEEERDYALDQTDLIREAATLDHMAKLITVEEVCASLTVGLRNTTVSW